MNKFLIAILVAAAGTSLPAASQILSGNIADTTLNRKMMVFYNPQRGGSKYDAVSRRLNADVEGNFSFDTDELANMKYVPAWLYLGDKVEYPILLEPGKNLNVTAKKEKGKTVLKFKGEPKEGAEYMRLFEDAFNFDEFFPYEEGKDTLTKAQKKQMLVKRSASLQKALKKIKDKDLRDYLTKLTDDQILNYSIRLAENGTPEMEKLMNQITVNDWRSLYSYLPEWAISDKVPEALDSCYGHDMTEYGLCKLKLIKENVTDPDVRAALLDNCAKVTLNYCKNYADIDRFWIPFQEYAGVDSPVVEKYAAKVKAIKTTKKGMPAKDFSFLDVDGKEHKLSDLKGKVIYIDCWATWCGPCCAEIPHLEKRVVEFKGNDKVEFISISLDTDVDAWLRKLAKDKPEWAQYRVNDEQHRVLSTAYGISGIPRFLVINADGTIADGDAFRPSDENFNQLLNDIIARQ